MKKFGCLINVKKSCQGFEIIKTPIKFESSFKLKRFNFNKFDSSISRAKSTIYDLIINNDFKFFVTLTLKPKYFDLSLSDVKNIINDRIKYMRKKRFF